MKHIATLLLATVGLMTLWLAKTLGNHLVVQFAIPIPGAVIGMLVIFMILMFLGNIPKPLNDAATPLLQHMNLLFIPAAVGLMSLGSLLSQHGLGIITAMLVSTLAGFWVCIQMYTKLGRRHASHDT